MALSRVVSEIFNVEKSCRMCIVSNFTRYFSNSFRHLHAKFIKIGWTRRNVQK